MRTRSTSTRRTRILLVRVLSRSEAGKIDVFGTCAFIVRPSALTVTSVQFSFRSVLISPSFTSSLRSPSTSTLWPMCSSQIIVSVEPIENRRVVAAGTKNTRSDLLARRVQPWLRWWIGQQVSSTVAVAANQTSRQLDTLVCSTAGARGHRLCDDERANQQGREE